MTWFRDGQEPAPGPYVRVYSIKRADWSVTFEAPESLASSASEWFMGVDADMQRNFDAMLTLVRPAYPNGGGRHFRILVLPPGSRLDRSWPQLAVSDRDLAMTFALPLPDPSDKTQDSVLNVNQLLAHEFSHSYYWFHREKFRNNFSDEVIAYTMQRCVEVELFGGSYGALDDEFHDFDQQVGSLRPAEIYAQFHKQYPDTYLALFAAVRELRRAESQAGMKPREAMLDYCRSIPTSGRDFTEVKANE